MHSCCSTSEFLHNVSTYYYFRGTRTTHWGPFILYEALHFHKGSMLRVTTPLAASTCDLVWARV